MAVGDLTTNFTNALSSDDATVAVNDLTVSDDATVTGTFSQSGAYSTTQDFAVNTTMFTVAAATGNTAVAGTLTVTGAADFKGGLTTDTSALAVADTTGVITMKGGATLDNNASSTVLNITETTVRVTGALDVTGGFTTDTNAFVIADTTGVVTMKGGATLDNNAAATTLTITETNIGLTGAVTVTGALDVTGGFTTDTNAFAVTDTTGVITMKGGATIDNNASATVLNITETTVRITGALDVTAGFTTDSTAFAIADTTGIVTMKGGATLDNNTSSDILNITEATVRVTGILDVTSNSTLASADIGGAYAAGTGSGVTIAAAGTISANGAILTDGAITSGVNGASGAAGTLTVNDGANPGAASFSVAGATGIITLHEGATIDNDTGTNTLTLTETNIALVGATTVTGALDVTGGFTTDSTAFAIADTTGIITMKDGATIDNDTGTTTLTVTSTTITLIGATGITGALDVTGGFTTDTNAFAIADTTGVVTMKGGATLDNNSSADVLAITELTVQVAGILDVTGNSTLASLDVGGGSGASGATIAATGVATFDGLVNANGGIAVDTDAFTVANTTGIVTLTNGAILDNSASSTVLNITESTVRVTGAFDVTGALTVATDKISIAAATGIITMNEGATIDNDTGTDTLTITENTISIFGSTAIGLTGTTTVTGALDVTGGFTTDTNALAIADTTGVITMKGGATLDNNASADILDITEATVRVTGILDVTGATTTASNVTVSTGVIAQTQTISTDALGTVRGVYGYVTTAGDGAISGGNTVGVRGYNVLSGIISAGGAYLYGTQGKLGVTGTMNHADSRLCAMLAQIDGTSGTFTAGQMSGLWVDVTGITGAGGGQFNLIRLTCSNGTTPNSLIYAQSDATYFMDLGYPSGDTTSYIVAAGTGANSAAVSTGGVAAKVLTVNLTNDGVYYIPLFSSNAS